ncbi:MAG: sigma 54-interacting transcriptional regulator [Deltaproteobacteria bacterium]|nr:sigma 54-interacting transcriptional regulator [Deltaproteobacteria bacterium]
MTKPQGAGRSAGTTAPTKAGQSEEPSARKVPGLVLAWLPPGLLSHDRAPIDSLLVVGRSSGARWCIPDDRLSRTHFDVRLVHDRLLLQDLGSRNGTWADGARLTAPREVEPGTVIRAGGCVFVLVRELGALAPPGDESGRSFGMAGQFHTGPLVKRLRVAARTGRHVLIEGETGVGKELAAQALHRLFAEAGRRGTLLSHNAARFAGEDDAVTTLFGVSRGAFTGVEPRPGAIELATGGTLFLDEVHNLPARVQRSLLRFVEDGRFQRVGEPAPRTVDVRLVLGTNLPVAQAADEGRLAHDLVARLHRVSLPPLRERRADVPAILSEVVRRRLPPAVADAVLGCLDAPVWERLCRHDFSRGNVREIEDLVSVAGARIAEGEGPPAAVASTLAEALPANDDPKPAHVGAADHSPYERHREAILAAFHDADGNLTRLEELLRSQGWRFNRRWLTVYLERWGVRSVRRRSEPSR